jgi:hypothetical protein
MAYRCLSGSALCSYLIASTLSLLLLAGCSDSNDNGNDQPASAVPTPMMEGPIAGDASLPGPFFPDQGYEKAEYFISGTAYSYTNVNELTSSGEWQVQEAEAADYTTRIIVFRPIEPTNANKTVVVEWLNVSAGADLGNDWMLSHTELMRSGYTWVGVSAQARGVSALKTANETRYAPLDHPGDSFSYSMYSQVTQLLRSQGDGGPLGSLSAEIFLAVGESQSATRILTYVNALAPIDKMFDGYLVHSRYYSSAPLSQTPQTEILPPEIVLVREDFEVPVLMFQTESDVVALRSYQSRQPDSDYFRLWETAGTAHADYYITITTNTDLGTDPQVAAVFESAVFCDKPINMGPQHWLTNAAFAALNRWAISGELPAEADRLTLEGSPVRLARDEYGIALGGIRTSYVNAPMATLSGEGNSSESFGFCNRLFGTTKLFDAQTLAALYGDNSTYISKVNASTDEAVSLGFLLLKDAALIKAYAAQSDIFGD